MVFKSKYPDIEYPTDLTVWEWAFEDKRYSPIFRNPPSELAGFSNAVTGERLNFLQVKEYATHLCTALTSQHGLRRGDTVSLFSQNSIWYPVAMFAVLRAGGRVNGASPSHTVDEMANALKTADTKFIMTVPQSVDTALAAARKVGIPTERIFLLEGELHGHASVSKLLEIGRARGEEGQTPFFRIAKGQTNDVCGYLNFSSGTTGLPKAVMLSHRNVIAQCLQLGFASGPERRRYLACLPLFHISGLVRFLHWPIASNDECVMLPQFTMENFLKAIQQFKITDLALVPSIVNRLVNDPLVSKYDLTSVKLIACGAAPLGEEVIKLLEKKLPWTGFRQSYGMTESCCCLTTHPPEYYSYKYADSGGVLLASTVIKIVDLDSGKELGPNETGEILARGPQIAMGYLTNPKETAETFGAEGFLHTGDIGCVDDKGFIHIVDRIKEMIKVKGQQVAPADLEQLLLGHPAVEDCAVLGIPDDRSSERPKAFVVLKQTVSPNPTIARELLQYVKDRKIRYKWLKEIEFISEVPKSPSGKILRRVLRGKRVKEDILFVFKDVADSSRL
ncbi:unnamed protein product [Clonostachys byssicola]|uniref:Uncharacterized protein n=1 Tax=Clonostachys byssicola TaxID=160290 RepID=A0A9N9Y9W4_9HYPO|nr:unnamed protein product [Clonostachys byssicola]